ncbi:MAG: hypothetical protein OXB84_03710, partial [Halobacteriovoraceae bacterium]|nr:hypothetical protein [Halobacteriovoraceae bacterium]
MHEKLKIKKIIKENQLLVELEGIMDEDASFENIPHDQKKEYLFDFNNIKKINSCGIREWISFLKKLDDNAHTIYQRCPRIIVDQMNRIQGFIKKGGKV